MKLNPAGSTWFSAIAYTLCSEKNTHSQFLLYLYE